MICCIDANTFIWGIKKQCTPGQEEMMQRAEHLFNWMDENKYSVMMPTIVVAEILSPEPLEKHPVFMERIMKTFMVPQFDIRAASMYATMFRNKVEEIKKLAKENNIDTQKMKTDHLIIACAVVNGANCIYSNDNGIKIFGQKYIEVKDLPPLPPPKFVQQSFFNVTG